MSRRPPSSPPLLPGFDYVKLLGSGGFADVFLYQQQHPRRQVAVKVLLKDKLGTASAEGFTEEANLMAQFASHPSIVSVYQAGVSDDGRPYLVMEYCSKPNLQARHRRERFSEAETLRVGIQIAGAVETAHRAGILHRDIKPANILVTDYNRPALTDFGISATTTDAMSGMSIPWSPPESLRTPPQGFPSSDVYSLAATLYTLLTNRSPFEIPGGSNTELDVMSRIQSMALPSTGRPDVSAALQAVLERAMAKDPTHRYASAIEFAWALQRVQIEHGMQATPIDVADDEILDEAEEAGEERTRFRGVTSIDAQTTPPASTGSATAPPSMFAGATTSAPPPTRTETPSPIRAAAPAALQIPGVSDETRMRPGVAGASGVGYASAPLAAPEAPPLGDTVVRPGEMLPASVAPGSRRRTVGWIVGAVGAAIVAGVVIFAVVASQGGAQTPRAEQKTAAPVDAVGDEPTVPTVADLHGAPASGGIAFTWTNPDPRSGDVYLWRMVVPGQKFTFEETSTPTVTVPADASGRTCIEVVLRRADGAAAADSAQGCVP